MKNLKLVAVCIIMTLGIFSTVLFTSCKKKPSCDGVVCVNGGTCADGTCSCPPGYEGARCETKKIADFAGQYIGGDICNGITENYNLIIGQTGASSFPITGLGGSIGIFWGTIVSSGSYNLLTIPSQNVGVSETISGSGILTGNTIVINYTISYLGGTQSCIFTGTK